MKVVFKLFSFYLLLNLNVQSFEIDKFYEALESNEDQNLSARLNLFSLKVTEHLKKKARYKLTVKKNIDGLYERLDSWNLSLNLTHDLISSELLFIDGGVEGRYQLKRHYKSRKEALLAKIISPGKIPLNAENINFLEIGNSLKIPLEARFGMRLSPSAFLPYQFIKGDVYALFKGLINLQLIRESLHKVRVILVVGTGDEKGSSFEAGLMSPELIFSVLDFEVDKVFDLDLYTWTKNISLIKGRIADYRIDLSHEEGRNCYNSFFKNYFKLKSSKFNSGHKALKLKSLSLLNKCSRKTFAVEELLYSRILLSEQNDRKKLSLGIYRNELDYKQVSIAFKDSHNINRFNFMRKNWKRKNYIPLAKNKASEIYEMIHIKEKTHDENDFQLKFSALDTKISKNNILRANQLISFIIEEIDQATDVQRINDHIIHQGKVDFKINLQFRVKPIIDSCLNFQGRFYRHFDYLNLKYPNFFIDLFKKDRSDEVIIRMIENKVNETGMKLCHLIKEVKSKEALAYLNKSKFFYFVAPSFLSKISKNYNLEAEINGKHITLGTNSGQNTFKKFQKTNYYNDIFNLNL